MKKVLMVNDKVLTDIDHLPAVNSFVTIGGFLYVVIRHEYDFDEEFIRIILIQTADLGEKNG
jgi:hypothetical protein